MVQVQIKCWHVLSGLVFPNIKQQWSFKGDFQGQLRQAYQFSSQSTVLDKYNKYATTASGTKEEGILARRKPEVHILSTERVDYAQTGWKKLRGEVRRASW